MTNEEREIALYCLKASSDYHSEVCEECVKYPNCDHMIQDDVTETIIKALEQARWIPISERLPEDIGTYMATVDYGMYGLAAGQRYYHGKGLGWEDDCVIAWMPLPEPYKESDNNDE